MTAPKDTAKSKNFSKKNQPSDSAAAKGATSDSVTESAPEASAQRGARAGEVRLPPQNLEAERSVLGSLMIDENAMH